jgi:rod shape-determining protein MreD
VLCLLAALAVVIQATIWPTLPVRPNVALVLVLLWTIARGPREGLFWAFGVGFFTDLVTVAPFGTHALALLPVVVAAAATRAPPLRLGLLLTMLGALAATLAHDAALLALQGVLGNLLPSLIRLSLLTGLLNIAAVALLQPLVTRLHDWQRRIDDTIGRPGRAGRPGSVVGRR